MGAIRYNVIQAIKALMESRSELIAVITLPAAGIAALSLVSAFAESGISSISDLFAIVFYCLLAIRVHRLILLKDEESPVSFGAAVFMRFLLWSFGVLLLGAVCILPITSVLDHFNTVPDPSALVVLLVSLFAALYVMARASLILPEQALARDGRFMEVWAWSRHNGWKLAGALFIPPFVLNLAIQAVTWPLPESIRVFVQAVLAIPILIVEVALLSVAYRHLRARNAVG